MPQNFNFFGNIETRPNELLCEITNNSDTKQVVHIDFCGFDWVGSFSFSEMLKVPANETKALGYQILDRNINQRKYLGCN